jgi:cytochrome P450
MSSDKKAEFGPKFGVSTPLYRHHTTSLVFNDPPLHTRVRKLLAAAFTPRALANLQPRIAAVVDGLLAQHADKGRMDLVEDFAFRLPVENPSPVRSARPPAMQPSANSRSISMSLLPSGANGRPTTATCWGH